MQPHRMHAIQTYVPLAPAPLGALDDPQMHVHLLSQGTVFAATHPETCSTYSSSEGGEP